MIRNLVLPVLAAGLAAALLGGCVSDYQYRGGNGGDYYYGHPAVEYRDYGYGGYGDPYGGGYGGGYGYPGGWSGSIGYGYGYGGNPYGYGGYGYPYGYGGYGGYPYWRPPVIVVRPGGLHHGGHRDNDGDNDGDDSLPTRGPGGGHPLQPPDPVPSIQAPQPMIRDPALRQDRMDESRMQPSIPRQGLRERDDGRKTTP